MLLIPRIYIAQNLKNIKTAEILQTGVNSQTFGNKVALFFVLLFLA